VGEASDGAAPYPDGAPASAGEGAEGSGPISNDGLVLPKSFIAAKAEALVPTTTPAPAAAQAVQPVTQPAAQVFAAAMAAVVHAPPRREEREITDARTPLAIASATIEALHTPAIAATVDAKQGAFDLRQDSGLQGMIDHIEVLRDNADAGDTRIRLVPDALGAIDVSVRREGERVHVHFNAENAASARLLSEAQPRLADLAEARGVKLGQTSVDSGARDTPPPPVAPLLAVTPAAAAPAESADIITDTRIA
jgi:flagellar hook-length control protein FliK